MKILTDSNGYSANRVEITSGVEHSYHFGMVGESIFWGFGGGCAISFLLGGLLSELMGSWTIIPLLAVIFLGWRWMYSKSKETWEDKLVSLDDVASLKQLNEQGLISDDDMRQLKEGGLTNLKLSEFVWKINNEIIKNEVTTHQGAWDKITLNED